MEQITEKIKTLIQLMGVDENDVEVNYDEDKKRASVVVTDSVLCKDVPRLLESLDHLTNLMQMKAGLEDVNLDVNNYRRERENLIVELAKAAAHKALVTKQSVELPPMNAYERRLIHLEISTKPDLKTESVGLGRDRRVVVKLLDL